MCVQASFRETMVIHFEGFVLFLMFTSCVGVTQLFSGFLSQGIVPYVGVDLVCPLEEVSLGDSYVAILSCNPCSKLLEGRNHPVFVVA